MLCAETGETGTTHLSAQAFNSYCQDGSVVSETTISEMIKQQIELTYSEKTGLVK